MPKTQNENLTIYYIKDQILEYKNYRFDAEYQRELGVWSKKMKQLLIDSILRGYDIPKFFLEAVESTTGHDDLFNILDGQHRLDTICKYIRNEFPTLKLMATIDGYDLSNLFYEELPTIFQNKIRNTKLTIVKLWDYSDSEIEELFLRLQSGKTLTAAEKRHAIRGDIRDIVCSVKNHKVFEYCTFKTNRYYDEDAIAKILRLIKAERIVDIKSNVLTNMYMKNRIFNQNNKCVKDLYKTLDYLHIMFSSTIPPYYVASKNLFISLAFAIYTLYSQGYVLDGQAKDIINAYKELESRRAQNNHLPPEDKNPALERYDRAIREEKAESLRIRHDMITKHLLSNLSLKKRDPIRQVSSEERIYIYNLCEGRCHICGELCDKDNFHVDHIEAYSLGGKTSLENLKVSCPSCNLKKSNKNTTDCRHTTKNNSNVSGQINVSDLIQT